MVSCPTSRTLLAASSFGFVSAQFCSRLKRLVVAYQTHIERVEYSKAAVEFSEQLQKADSGDAQALFNVAKCYWHGYGTPADEREAVQKCRAAAERGHTDAAFNIANCYRDGTVAMAKDEKQAVHWYLKAFGEGHLLAGLQLLLLNALPRDEDELQRDLAAGALEKAGDWQRTAKRWDLTFAKLVVVENSEMRAPFTLLAKSQFGQAVRCQLQREGKSLDVVVKVPKNPKLNGAWLNEWLAMALEPHPNVLGLLALCRDFKRKIEDVALSAPLSFVTRFCTNGSIVDFFKKHNPTPTTLHHLLITWGLDVAKGLAHLHRHNCVHRDIAARNVFLDDDCHALVCACAVNWCVTTFMQVGDLGLARSLGDKPAFLSKGKSGQYQADCAPQVISEQTYTPADDIFSFGLLLFEIATQCADSEYQLLSFIKTDPKATLTSFMAEAQAFYPRLFQKLPRFVRQNIRTLMQQCLKFERDDRPTAEAIVSQLSAPSFAGPKPRYLVMNGRTAAETSSSSIALPLPAMPPPVRRPPDLTPAASALGASPAKDHEER